MNTQTVTINLVPGLSTPPVVNVKQGDIGRPIAFRVMDGTGLMTAIAGATAKIEGTKPSGLGFSVTGTISGNMVTLDTTEAMTQEAGRIPAEISFTKTGLVLGTANFILAVERDPHPENVTDGTYETMADIQTQVNALDTRVTALEAGGGGSGLTDDVKTALLQIAQKVAYIDAHGQDYYDDLYDALYSSTTRSVLLVLSHVSSSNTQSTVEAGDSYSTTLTASTNYTINSVTVTMGGVDVTSTTYSSGTVSIPSVTGNIVITATAVLAAQSITATYTQSGTVYDTDSLDSLKADLVVTATFADSSTAVIPATDYTLSGTLLVGTSTITVSYGGKTASFNVTVSERTYVTDGLFAYWDAIDNQANGAHSSNATTWVDKINGYTWTAAITNETKAWSWDDDALILSPASTGNVYSYGKNNFLCPRPETGLRTLEIVVIPNGEIGCVGEFTSDLTGITDTTTQILGVFTDNTFTTKGVQNGYSAGDITSIRCISATYDSSYAAVKAYMNGQEVTTRGSSHSFKYHGLANMVLGAQNNGNGINDLKYPFKGKIHAIRMYSKELTAAEIAQNYAIDVARFSLS